MSEKQAVNVKILDREYRIACEADERKNLLDAADYLDGQMRAIRAGSNMVSMEKAAVLAALNIANEFLLLKKRESEFGENVVSRVKALREKLETSLAGEG